MAAKIELHHGDCLEVMPTLPAQSVAMCFADLPYALAKHKCTDLTWDLPFEIKPFSRKAKRLLTENAPLVMSANMRFASHLIAQICIPFRYDLVWQKTRFSGFLNAKKMPLRAHEHLLLFYNKAPNYTPMMRDNASGRSGKFIKSDVRTKVYGEKKGRPLHILGAPLQPISVFSVKHPNHERGLHPTQKPVALLEWLIKTYTNPGDTVLDPVGGSFTTAIACLRTGRNCVVIEKDSTYFALRKARVEAAQRRLEAEAMSLFPEASHAASA